MFAHMFKFLFKDSHFTDGEHLPQDGTLRWSFDLNSEDPQNPSHWAGQQRWGHGGFLMVGIVGGTSKMDGL